MSSSSTSIAEWVELTFGARFTVGLILRLPNGTNLESGREDSLRSLSVAVVRRDEARLLVDATLRATLRTEAEEDWICEGVPVRVWFLFNTEVHSE